MSFVDLSFDLVLLAPVLFLSNLSRRQWLNLGRTVFFQHSKQRYVAGGQIHGVNLRDELLFEAGAIHLLYRGYANSLISKALPKLVLF